MFISLYMANFDKTKLKGIIAAVSALVAAILAAFGLSSCGVTKAYITQPKDGSTTSITITTNNPISTSVDPTTNADILNK